MVIDSAAPKGGSDFTRRRHPRIRSRSNLQRLVISAYNLVSIEVRLWLLQTQRSVRKIVLAAICGLFGALVGLLGMVFLYIFLFQWLAQAWGSRCALLIFAVVHLVGAVVLFSMSQRALNAKAPEDESAV